MSTAAAGSDRRARLSDRLAPLMPRLWWLVLAAGLGFGLTTALAVAAGRPQDEPAHWLNTLFYSQHRAMPVLGRVGTTYEAQQPPLAYVLAAVVESVATDLFGVRAGFDAVRILGGCELLVAAWLAARILRRFVADALSVAVAVGFLVCSPMFIAMAWSVQNDALAVMLILAATEFTLARLSSAARPGDGLAAGALTGLGLLAKFTAWPLVIVLPVWILLRHGRRGWGAASACLVAVLAVAGWWFARNLTLYGDLLPSRSLPGGESFLPLGFSVASIGHVLEELVTYMWLPTEFYSNLISAPAALKGLLLVISVAVVAWPLRRLVALRRTGLRAAVRVGNLRTLAATPAGLIALTGVLAIAGWMYQSFWVTAAAARLAYADLPLWLLLIADLLGCLRGRVRLRLVLALGAGALLIVLDVGTLVSVLNLHAPAQLEL